MDTDVSAAFPPFALLLPVDASDKKKKKTSEWDKLESLLLSGSHLEWKTMDGSGEDATSGEETVVVDIVIFFFSWRLE